MAANTIKMAANINYCRLLKMAAKIFQMAANIY